MIKRTRSFHQTKTLVSLAIAVSLAACSAGTETNNSPTTSASLPPIDSASSSSPQTTTSPASITIPGVADVKEINFKAAQNSANGFFNGVPDGPSGPKVEVPKATPFNTSGWAIISNEGRPADMVILTYGDTNSVVAVAPVNLQRPDVVKTLKNSAYQNSGWSTTVNPSALPDDRVVLKAWAYNSASKEATQLNNSLQVVLLE